MPKVSESYRDARRAEILTAARESFVREGFHATSIQDVCRRAGVSPGVVYLYFRGKDDLITAIVTQNLERIGAVASAAAGRGEGPGVMMAELLDHVRTEQRQGGLASIAVLAWSESLRNRELADRLRAATKRVQATFAAALRGGDNDLDSDGADETARILVSVLIGHVMQCATQPEASSRRLPAAVRRLDRLVGD